MKLSKTNFLICLDCAKNAWLKIHKPDVYKKKALSSFELNIIDTGNQIDELAHSSLAQTGSQFSRILVRSVNPSPCK